MKKIRNSNICKINKDNLVALLNKFSLLLHGMLSCGICFFIETVSRHSMGEATHFLWDRSWVFLFNALIIFTTFLIVYLFKRRAFLRVLISGIWIFLGIVNGAILAKRVTPFGYTDLKMIKDLLSMKNNYYSTSQVLLVLFGIALFVGLNIFLWTKGPRFKEGKHFIIRLCLVASSLIWLPGIINAAVNRNLLTDYFTNIAQGYEKYGFVYGFSTSVLDRGMKEPKNYSLETIQTIKESKMETLNINSSKHGNNPNIIVVQLESFMDPEDVNFLNYSKDPIPNFRTLSETYSSGYIIVPVIGAGTANTEFEILTGMNLRFFGTGEYPYKTVLKNKSCESIAGNLHNLGYGTHAIHNNGGNFYSRANAFSKMGFDSFISEEFMNIQEYNPLNTWAKDTILLGEIEKTLKATPKQKDFIYTISVQSHGDYPEERVSIPEILVSGCETQEKNYKWEYYLNQIKEVDAFIGDLVNQLEEQGEETLLILFGDHLPTIGLEKKDMKSNSLFKTKYATWNNFGMPKKDADLYSYQLLAEMTNQLGIQEGTMFTYHQRESESEFYQENMELLQYDILYGEKYFYNQADAFPASELIMGIEDIIISEIRETKEGIISLYGENFTPWSRVYVNGEKVSTKFQDENEVTIKKENLEKGDVLVVNQLGSKSTIFRSSNEFIYDTALFRNIRSDI